MTLFWKKSIILLSSGIVFFVFFWSLSVIKSKEKESFVFVSIGHL